MTDKILWIQIGEEALSSAEQLVGSKRADKFKKKLRRLLAAAKTNPTRADDIRDLLAESAATRSWAKRQLAHLTLERGRHSKPHKKRAISRKLHSEALAPNSFKADERVWISPTSKEEPEARSTKKAFANVRVLYATDRKPTGNKKPDKFYAADRGELTFGSVEISIPHDHRMGQLEGPAWWKLEFRKDPTRHVVLLNLDVFDRDGFVQNLRKSLVERPSKQALVFVHGYNVSFEDSCRRTAQIAYDLKFEGVPVAYSWPSEGKTQLYLVDETNVHWSVTHFQRLLCLLLNEIGAEAVHVIAHSMGNRALVEALRALDTRELQPTSARLTQVIFAAPDIDAATFQEIAEDFRQKAARFTLYTSSRDAALIASKVVHKYPRAGECGKDLVLLDGIDTIDATKVDTELMGHSYIGNNDSILADVYDLLRDGSPPRMRFRLRRRERLGREYWMFQS